MPRIPNPGAKMLASSPCRWLAALRVADSIDEIVGVARQFVEDCSPRELLRIPAYARPGRISDAGQIRQLAQTLARTRANFTGRLVDAMVLDRVAAFFEQALHQVTLMGPSQGSRQRLI